MISTPSTVSAIQTNTNTNAPSCLQLKKPRLAEECGEVKHPEPMCLDTLRIDQLYSDENLRNKLDSQIKYQRRLIDVAINKGRDHMGNMINRPDSMNDDLGEEWRCWSDYHWTLPAANPRKHVVPEDYKLIISITASVLNEMLKKLDELSTILCIKHRSLVFRAYERLPPFIRLQTLVDNTMKAMQAEVQQASEATKSDEDGATHEKQGTQADSAMSQRDLLD